MPFKRSASADPEGLDLSVNLPFEMLRRRYVQALARGSMGQVLVLVGIQGQIGNTLFTGQEISGELGDKRIKYDINTCHEL